MFFYQILEENLFREDIGSYTSFGLKVIYATYGIYLEVLRISDVSTDKLKVARLASLCTRGQVSPIHIIDVAEDYLN